MTLGDILRDRAAVLFERLAGARDDRTRRRARRDLQYLAALVITVRPTDAPSCGSVSPRCSATQYTKFAGQAR